MGFLSNLGGIGSAIAGIVNPVSLIANVGAGILGGGLDYLGAQQTNQANATNVHDTNALNYQIAMQQNALQEEFAKNGVQMRVADANAAGISPLAALGAVTPTINPAVPVMQSSPYQSPLSSISPHLTEMGQNISRAAMATATEDQRELFAANLRKAKADASYAETQALNAAIEVGTKVGPQLPTKGSSGNPVPAYVHVRNKDGSVTTMTNPELGIATHDEPFGTWRWYFNNKFIDDFAGPLTFGR